eukprot:gene14820-biopygen12606
MFDSLICGINSLPFAGLARTGAVVRKGGKCGGGGAALPHVGRVRRAAAVAAWRWPGGPRGKSARCATGGGLVYGRRRVGEGRGGGGRRVAAVVLLPEGRAEGGGALRADIRALFRRREEATYGKGPVLLTVNYQ